MLLLLPLSILSCEVGSNETDHFTVRDSVGVRIVENYTAAWSETDAWRLGERPVLDIGGLQGGQDYELHRVVGAIRLADGRIVVANAGTHDIRFYGADGGFLSSTGGEGAGPGEFQALEWIDRYRVDSLIAYDMRQRRLTVYDSDGNRGRSFASSGSGEGSSARAVSPFSDGSVLTSGSVGFEPDPSRAWRSDIPLYTMSATGEAKDSLAVYQGQELFMLRFEGGALVFPVIFGRDTYYDTYGDLLYVAPNDSYEFHLLSKDGVLQTIVRRLIANTPVTRDDLETAKAELLENAAGHPVMTRSMEDMFDRMPIPSTLPAFQEVMVDDNGNVWLQDYNRPSETVPRWTVFAANGQLYGTMTLPERFEPLHIGQSHVVGRWSDNMDVEHVEVYELIKR